MYLAWCIFMYRIHLQGFDAGFFSDHSGDN
jgi:hypothetical protein